MCEWDRSGRHNSHGHCRFHTSYPPACEFVETREIPEMKALVLQPTAEFVETYLLSLRIFMVFDIRYSHLYLRYSIYAVRKLFGHMAGVSDRYFPPTFYNEPLAS
jgi:hypothetical protein